MSGFLEPPLAPQHTCDAEVPDAPGNVLERHDSDLGVCAQGCVRWDSGQTLSCAFAGSDDQLTSSSGKIAESFASNGMGSLASRSVTSPGTFDSDLQQELVGVCTTSTCSTSGGATARAYAYDGLGNAAGATAYTAYFVYVGSTLAHAYNATSGLKSCFVCLGDPLPFRRDSGSTTAHFYAADLSNNVRVVWSYSGGMTVELKQRYKPFGELAAPLNTPNPDTTRFKYAEQLYSPPTKLYAMGARSYAPDLGRFVSRDPVGGHGYAYAADNPLSFWDPSGKDVWSTIGGILGWSWNVLTGTLGRLASASASVNAAAWSAFSQAVGTSASVSANAWASAGSGLSSWWNGLDPNVRSAIVFTVLAAGIILTAGALAPVEVGAIGAMTTVGLTEGATASIAAGAYVLNPGPKGPSLTGLLAAAAKGAFLGGLGAVAGPLAGEIAAPLGFGEVGAGLIEGGLVLGSTGGADILMGQSNPAFLAEDMTFGLIGAGAGDYLFPDGEALEPQTWFQPAGNVVVGGAFGEAVGEFWPVAGNVLESEWNRWAEASSRYPGPFL